MKWIYILLMVTMLMCSIGIVSADDENESGVVIGGIIDMEKVSEHGGTFWKSANENGGAGYLLLGIGLVSWLLIIMFAAFGGSASYAVGTSNNNADATKKGTDTLKRVVVAIVAPPVLLILLGIFVGLI
jgi:hypothetical protein